MAPRRAVRVRKAGCGVGVEMAGGVWPPYPGLCAILFYTLHLLDYCQSVQDGLYEYNENVTNVETYLGTTIQDMGLAGQIQDGDVDGQKTQDGRTFFSPPPAKSKKSLDDDSRENDVLHKLGLDSAVTEESVSTSSPATSTATSTTERPPTTTRRHIYIRGHLLKHPPPGPKTFPPPDTPSGFYRAPNSVHLSRVHNHRDTDQDSGNRKKRKHNANKERFHNYKLLYDTLKGGGDAKHKKTEFYAWIFGSAMLGLGGITMVTSFIIFCFCGNRARKKRAAHARRPSNKAGEYQRVESVSSIVDHGGDPLETIYEEPTDSVTII